MTTHHARRQAIDLMRTTAQRCRLRIAFAITHL